MDQVDYLILADQYASFLVAVGGVSITALTLVLSLGYKLAGRTFRPCLVSALVVATVSCFLGAQMMTETAAFISHSRAASVANPLLKAASGERLFLLASTNIFVAVILVLFSLMLLPMVSSKTNATTMTPISVSVFLLVLVGACGWLALAAFYRMPTPETPFAIIFALSIGLLWCICLHTCFKKYLLWASFISIVFLTVALHFYFAWYFHEGDKVHALDIYLFCSIITLSYISLVVDTISTMRGEVATLIAIMRRKRVTRANIPLESKGESERENAK